MRSSRVILFQWLATTVAFLVIFGIIAWQSPPPGFTWGRAINVSLLVASALLFVRWQQAFGREQRAHLFCLRCGYPRTTRETKSCPECGHPFPPFPQ